MRKEKWKIYRIIKLVKWRNGVISETEKVRTMALEGPIFIQSTNISTF